MANIIQVVLQGDDKSKAAFESATRSAKQFKAAHAELNHDIRAGSILMRQSGAIAQGFGGAFGSVFQSIASAGTELRHLSGALGTSKLAMLALGTVAAVVAEEVTFAFGKILIDQHFKAFRELWSGISENTKIAGRAYMDLVAAINEPLGRMNAVNVAIDEQIAKVTKLKNVSEESKQATIGQLEALRKVQLAKIPTSEDKANDLLDSFIEKTVAAKDTTTDRYASATAEHKAALKQIEDLAKSEGVEVELIDAIRDAENQLFEARKANVDAGTAEETLKLWQKAKAASGELLRGSDFGGGKSSHTFYTPQQGAEFLQIQNQYDEMLTAFQKYTSDKDQISQFATTVEKARSQAEKDFKIKLLQDEVKERQRIAQAVLGATAGLFGSLAALASAQGKKGFAIAQAFRYAETIVNTAAGVARALAEFPWPYSAVVGGLVAAAGAVQLATIASAKPTKAHAGLEYVPRESLYQLSQGERVIAPGQNVKLEQMLEDHESGGGRGMSQILLYIDGTIFARAIGNWSRDGRLQLDARSVS